MNVKTTLVSSERYYKNSISAEMSLKIPFREHTMGFQRLKNVPPCIRRGRSIRLFHVPYLFMWFCAS